MVDENRKLISFVGDSISTFHGCNPEEYHVFYEGGRCAESGVKSPKDTWWSLVADHFGQTVLSNASFSGSTVEGPGFPCGESPRRIADISANGKVPDDIVVFFGINDYGWGGFANMAAGRARACPELPESQLPAPAVAKEACDDEPLAFQEAYARMLEKCRSAYPNARVWCCTLLPGSFADDPNAKFAYCLRGIPFDEYNEAIRAAAQACECRTVDLRSFGLDYESLEGTHPTALGMRQLAAMVILAMEKAGAPTLPLDPELETALRSAKRSPDPCGKQSCIGCPSADATGNAWLCGCRRHSSSTPSGPSASGTIAR